MFNSRPTPRPQMTPGSSGQPGIRDFEVQGTGLDRVSNRGIRDFEVQGTGLDRVSSPQMTPEPESASSIGNGFRQATTSNTPESQTSAGRLDQMLASDSPLMQRAATQGRQMANNRGLLNSSMAAGASQGAMIDRAQPFALQDSNNMYRENQFNADAQNRFSLQTNDFMGRGQLADQGYQHQYGLNNQQFRNTGFLNDQQYLHDLGRATHGFDIQSALNDQGYIQNVGLIGAELGANQQMSAQDFMEQYQLAQQQGNISSDMSYQDFMQQTGLNEQQFGNQRTLNQDEYSFRSDMSEQDFQEQLGLAAQGFGFETQLSQQNFYEGMSELYASANANGWGTMANNITEILGESGRMIDQIQLDPNISPEDKESLISGIQDRDQNLIEIQQGLLGNLPEVLDNTGAFPNRPTPTANQPSPGVNDVNTVANNILGRSLTADEKAQVDQVTQEFGLDANGVQNFIQSAFNSGQWTGPGGNQGNSQNGGQSEQGSSGEIASIYEEVLGRSPDSSGLAEYQQMIDSGEMTISEVRNEIASSPEGQLSALYQEIFGRSPGADARDHYLEKLSSGVPIEQIEAELMASPEYQNA